MNSGNVLNIKFNMKQSIERGQRINPIGPVWIEVFIRMIRPIPEIKKLIMVCM